MKRALISVTDKTNVVSFAKGLVDLGYEIISTGGTKKVLDEALIKTKSISEITGFPEILDGRVKTLHPMVHGGLLAVRDNLAHQEELKENGISYIDLVCVNLYRFKSTIESGASFSEAIENIDIGGPSMLRSAAKNHKYVTVVSDINDYDLVLNEIKEYGDTLYETRLKLAAKVFTLTASYDTMIASYLREKAGLDEKLYLEGDLVQKLRYGENPHQSAKFYALDKNATYSLANSKQLQGKELSYNNIQDANACLNIVKEFKDKPFVVGLKHMNPCGAAIGADLCDAWTKAYFADPVSIYGGIVATNQIIDKKAAKLMKFCIPDHPLKEGEKKQSLFLEVILAPGFTEEALAEFKKRENLRLIEYKLGEDSSKLQYVSVHGGLLVQEEDWKMEELNKDMTVTNRMPSDSELSDMDFAWKIVKHVKSNAIVVVKDLVTCGIGAGQMNRVGSAEIAIKEAHERNHKENLVLASDGFLPFGDTVKFARENGVCAIVQPGGSIRDEESIKEANDANMTMLFTGVRHFKH